MWLLNIVVLSLLASTIECSQPENQVHFAFTSVWILEQLARAETHVIGQLEEAVDRTSKNLREILRLIILFKNQSHSNNEDLSEFVTDPIYRFQLIKRLVNDWKQVGDLLSDNVALLKSVRLELHDTLNGTTESDLQGAAESLLRLQETYDLSVKQLIQTTYGSKQQPSKMTAASYLEMAHQCLKKNLDYYTLMWTFEALYLQNKRAGPRRKQDRQLMLDNDNYGVVGRIRGLIGEVLNFFGFHNGKHELDGKETETEVKFEDPLQPLRQQWEAEDEDEERGARDDEHLGDNGNSFLTGEEETLYYVAVSARQQGRLAEAIMAVNWLVTLKTNSNMMKKYIEARKLFYRELGDQTFNTMEEVNLQKPGKSFWNRNVEFKYYDLCQGKEEVDIQVSSKLFCHYVDHGDPYLRLAPFKEEEKSLRPRIVIYHDVIYDSEISSIRQLSVSQMVSSGLIKNDGSFFEDFYVRVSTTAFLEASSVSDLVRRVEERAQLMSRLTIDTAEDLQVLNYGIGGHYWAHFDFFLHRGVDILNPHVGNRIATLLFYMSDVGEGGATVFPEANVAVRPRKGTAVLWYNLFKDGQYDYKTRHAACPVLVGSKWVCTKWFHYDGQEFNRPCSMVEDSERGLLDKALDF